MRYIRILLKKKGTILALMSIMQKLTNVLELTFRINLVILRKAIDAPVQTVASAKRSVKPGRKTVRLTSSQVAIAKN